MTILNKTLAQTENVYDPIKVTLMEQRVANRVIRGNI